MRSTPAASSSRREREVHSISALPPSAGEDRGRRMRTYTASMLTRTACFGAAAVVTVVDGPAWLAWVCIAAAVLLPYPAVVAANNVNRRTVAAPPRRHVHRELVGGSGPATGDRPRP